MKPRIDQEPQETLSLQLRRLYRWLALGIVVGVVALIATNFRIVQLLPPSLEPHSAEFAAASTQVLVDFPGRSVLLDTKNPVGPLAERANVYARLAVSPAILELIAEKAGIEPAQIDARGPYNPYAERIQREPTAERRASQLRAERQGYRLRFDTEQSNTVPIVLVYAQAPTVPAAERLADAGAAGLTRFVRTIQEAEGLADVKRLELRQLGRATGAIVNPGVDRQIAALVFIAALLAWSVLVVLASNLRRILRGRAGGGARPRPAPSRRVFDAESVDNPLTGPSG